MGQEFSFIKNKSLLDTSTHEAHAFVKYRVQYAQYNESILEEIAIGQSLGAWETSHVSEKILKQKVAKIVEFKKFETYFEGTIAFPWNLWHGNLSWLLTIIYGKMSFYPGIQLNSINFSLDCKLNGPKNSLEDIRKLLDLKMNGPLLMGILKPNVAMEASKIRDLYEQAADAGIHILKDDEIRFDNDENEILKRISLVAEIKRKKNLKTLYAVHLQVSGTNYINLLKRCEDSGADAFLINTWICGLDTLQNIRNHTQLPIFSHPALVGAFGFDEHSSSIHPRVTMAQLIRAAGADFSLFPSPYGKLGLPKNIALEIANECLNEGSTHFKPMTPVPSAGIKPSHAPLAKEDFGQNFVLNAGTGIFSGPKTIQENIYEFQTQLAL